MSAGRRKLSGVPGEAERKGRARKGRARKGRAVHWNRAIARHPMPQTSTTTFASTAPVEVERPTEDTRTMPDFPWLVIVWNDPINLMSYVTYVFQKLFGYSFAKASKL